MDVRNFLPTMTMPFRVTGVYRIPNRGLHERGAHLVNESEYVCGSPGRRNELPIVLSGCSGGGKSTLLSEMSRRGYSVQPEPGRQIVMEQMAIHGDGVPW